MSRALAGLYADAAEALRFDDRETAARLLAQAADDLANAARLLAQAADDLANASPLLADETQAIVDTLPRMDADDVRRAAGDCRMVAADLAAGES